MAKHFESLEDIIDRHAPSQDAADMAESLHEKHGQHLTFAEMADRIELQYPIDPDDLADVMKQSLGGADPRLHFYSVRTDSMGFVVIESDVRVKIKNNLEPDEVINAYVVLRPCIDTRGNTLYTPATWYQDAGMDSPPPHEFIPQLSH